VTILDALSDPQLFAPAFADGDWSTWRAFLAAVGGLPMSPAQRRTFRACTGRRVPPSKPTREAWVIVGRRGGKSRIAALLAVWLACFQSYALARGEHGTLPVIAADRKQARVVLGYVKGLLHGAPMLKALIEREGTESIELTNGVSIEVHTASWRSVRGYTVVGAVLDEVAVWRSEESANPDREILAALRPAMATVDGALLVAISSPYARRGVLWDAYRRHFKKAGDVLVWQAATRTMNPSVPQKVIDAAMEEDEAAALAEYGAQFRRDVEAFVSREVVEAATVPGRRELPPQSGVQHVAYCDPSGGSVDSFTVAIAHQEPDGAVVLDCLRERKAPFSPDAVVADFAAVLKQYGCTRVVGDRYAGEWPREAFLKAGIVYETSERTKSDLYGAALPLLNSGRVQLLDEPRLQAQLCGLERRTSRAGKDSIDSGPHGHDDVSNAACGALVLANQPMSTLGIQARGLSPIPLRAGLNLTSEDPFAAAAESFDYENEAVLWRLKSERPPWPSDDW
jgi:hypothetical protein